MILTPDYAWLLRYFHLKNDNIESEEIAQLTVKILDYLSREHVLPSITPLDDAILTSFQNVGVTGIPGFWIDGKLLIPNSTIYPACLYGIEGKERLGSDGYMTKTVLFYMFNYRKKDIDLKGDVNPKQDYNTKKILEFLGEVKKYNFNVSMIGDIVPNHDQISVLEVGKEFTLEFSWLPC